MLGGFALGILVGLALAVYLGHRAQRQQHAREVADLLRRLEQTDDVPDTGAQILPFVNWGRHYH